MNISLSSSSRFIALCSIVLCLCVTVTWGQTYRTVPSNYELGSWVFKPVYRSDHPGNRVEHIVAFAKPGTTSGENILAIWYQRPAVDGTPWAAKAWESASIAEAIKAVKVELGIPDDDDGTWPNVSSIEIQGAAAAAQAKDYDKGLLIDDPLYAAIAGAAERDEIVNILKEWGFKVADPSFEKQDGDNLCLKEQVLLGIAESAATIIDVTSESASAANLNTRLQTAFDAYQTAVAVRCGISIPIPWDAPDVAPKIVIPQKWFPNGDPEPWTCRPGYDNWSNCFELHRFEPGRVCITKARIRNNQLDITVCCFDCERFTFKLCCNVASCIEAVNCTNPVDSHSSLRCVVNQPYNNPPCDF